MATPSGCAIWRIPIASPRRWGGNQPTTMRPLAEPVQAANMPTTNRVAPSSDGVVHLRRDRAEDDRAAETGQQHGALADAVDGQAPEEERHHHAGDRHRREGAGLGQGQSAVVLQGRDQERRAVDRHGRPGLRATLAPSMDQRRVVLIEAASRAVTASR